MNSFADVSKMISGLENVDMMADKKFYIIHFNVFCAIDRVKYIPNEIGIVRYSIRNGIEDSYHNFIHPGPIPLGYAAICKQLSHDTHAIPICGFKLADKDYHSIHSRISNFVKPSHGFAALFCEKDSLAQTASCLHWICEEAKHPDVFHFRLYPINALLSELLRFITSKYPSKSSISNKLNTSNYDYVSSSRCDFHEKLDSRYCAVGCAKRLCYIVSDAVCSHYGVHCTTQHLPKVGISRMKMEVEPFSFPQSKTAWKNSTCTIPKCFTAQKYSKRSVADAGGKNKNSVQDMQRLCQVGCDSSAALPRETTTTEDASGQPSLLIPKCHKDYNKENVSWIRKFPQAFPHPYI